MPQKIYEGLDGNDGTGDGFFTGEAMLNMDSERIPCSLLHGLASELQ